MEFLARGMGIYPKTLMETNPSSRTRQLGFLRERGNWEAWNLRVGRLGNPIGNRKEDDRDPYLGQRIP